jgi:hypothetical protein
VASVEVACRAVRLMSRAEVWMTFIPGTERRVSAMFWAGWAARASLVTTLMVAGASISLLATLEALSTVTSSARRTLSSSFAFSAGFCPDAAGSWARSGAAVRTPRPSRARSSRFIVVLLNVTVPPTPWGSATR